MVLTYYFKNFKVFLKQNIYLNIFFFSFQRIFGHSLNQCQVVFFVLCKNKQTHTHTKKTMYFCLIAWSISARYQVSTFNSLNGAEYSLHIFTYNRVDFSLKRSIFLTSVLQNVQIYHILGLTSFKYKFFLNPLWDLNPKILPINSSEIAPKIILGEWSNNVWHRNIPVCLLPYCSLKIKWPF